MQATNIENPEESFHWSSQISECIIIITASDGLEELPFNISGGASEDSLCFISDVNQNLIRCERGQVKVGDLILEVQGEKVAGFVVQDLVDLIWSVAGSNGGARGWVTLKMIPEEYLPRCLTTHLGQRFPKDTLDYQLQLTIRRNIYRRALPYTTRPPREDELDGVDYKFLSVEEFLELERSGKLLEKGVYEGNYYGTPKPDVVVGHVIPWNGLPEHLYSLVSKHNTGTVASRTPTSVASVAVIASHFCPNSSSSTSPRSSNNSSANTTLVSPMSRKNQKMTSPLEGRDNEDALNNNSNNTITDTTRTNIQQQIHLISPTSGLEVPGPHNLETCYDECDPVHTNQVISTVLVKGPRGLGFTIVGIEDEETGEVWLVVKNVMEGGPADDDRKLMRGDILVRVDDRSISGMSHAGVVQMFRDFEINQPVAIEVLRTPNSCNLELLDLDLCDPPMAVITTVGDNEQHRREEILRLGIDIIKGKSGFGFTLADRPEGQKVKQLVDQDRCRGLDEGDLLLQINNQSVTGFSHPEVVNYLKACPVDRPARFLIERRVVSSRPNNNTSFAPTSKLVDGGMNPYAVNNNITSSFRNSPTSFRPLSAGVGARASPLRQHTKVISSSSTPPIHVSSSRSPSSANSGQGSTNRILSPAQFDPSKSPYFSNARNHHTPDFIPASAFASPSSVSSIDQSGESNRVEPSGGNTRLLDLIPTYQRSCSPHDSFSNFGCRQQQTYLNANINLQQHYQQQHQQHGSCCSPLPNQHPNSWESLHFSGTYHHFHSPVLHQKVQLPLGDSEDVRFVTLKRSPNGFGFRIVGGREEGTQVSVGYIVPSGPAHREGSLRVGQEIISVDGRMVVGAWHKEIVDLVISAGQKGEITIGVRESADAYDTRVMTPHEVILNRGDGDGFGFYILSSGHNVGSVIGQIIENSPASRSQALRVGDQILAINDTSIDRMKHEQIVELIKSSGQTIKLTISEGSLPPPPHANALRGVGDAGRNSPCLSVSPSPSKANTPPNQGATSPFPPPPQTTISGGYQFTKSPPIHHYNSPPIHYNLPMEVTIVQVDLIRGAKGFGFSLRGGIDFGLPVYVLKVSPDGSAGGDGRLQAGDEILKINGQPTSNLSHREAINMVQSSAHKLNLLVRRLLSYESSADL